MSASMRELRADDANALRIFVTEVPDSDRTFFKEDIDEPDLAARWLADRRSVRRLSFDDDGRIIAFASLVPGVARSAHVAELRLVLAPHARRQGLGTDLARQMLVLAMHHGFRKLTVEVMPESEGVIEMFRDIGFVPEALLCDQILDDDGEMRDLIVLAHHVEDAHSALVIGGPGASGEGPR